MKLANIKEVNEAYTFQDEIERRVLKFGLDAEKVKKLHNSMDPEKLVYEWTKTGNVDLKTFKKLLRYLNEV